MSKAHRAPMTVLACLAYVLTAAPPATAASHQADEDPAVVRGVCQI
jgi:hypothetical protein